MSFANQRRRSRSRPNRRSRSMNRSRPLPAIAAEEKKERLDEVYHFMNPDPKPLQLSFSCQMAHCSETIRVSGFNSVAELYEQIAKGFDLSPDDIIYCTRNTTAMENLFTGYLEEDDLLLVHMRGQPVEIELAKTADTLGITVADNGFCRSFIKKIREGTAAAATSPAIAPGQLIESIQGQSTLGLRHFEVAKMIRDIPIGQDFHLRLISPLQSGFQMFQQRRSTKTKTPMSSGCGTVRFKADGAVVRQTNAPNKNMIDSMNTLFRNYLGLEDDELAQTIWDTAVGCTTLQEMFQKVRDSDLQIFGFPDELVFDMWGIIGDIKGNQ